MSTTSIKKKRKKSGPSSKTPVNRLKGLFTFKTSALSKRRWIWRWKRLSNPFLWIPCVSFALAGLFYFTPIAQLFQNSLERQFIKTTQSLGFKLQEIFIEGRTLTPSHILMQTIGMERNSPLFLKSLSDLKDQLEQISWIRQATIKRQLPDKLYIYLEERHPLCLWQNQQKFYLIDDQGVVVSEVDQKLFSTLPLVVGENAPNKAPHILKIIEKFPEAKKSLKALTFISQRRWDLLLENKITIKLPEEKVEEALAKLQNLIKQKKVIEQDLSVIDLRIAGKVIMKMGPTSLLQLKGKGVET